MPRGLPGALGDVTVVELLAKEGPLWGWGCSHHGAPVEEAAEHRPGRAGIRPQVPKSAEPQV